MKVHFKLLDRKNSIGFLSDEKHYLTGIRKIELNGQWILFYKKEGIPRQFKRADVIDLYCEKI